MPPPTNSIRKHTRVSLRKKSLPQDCCIRHPTNIPRPSFWEGSRVLVKEGLARAANNELADTAVTIDPDNLRRFHPSIKEFRSADPYGWSGLTQRDAGQWAEELLHAAADGGQEAVSVDRTAGVNPPSSVECGRRPMPAAMVMGMWPRQQPVVWVHG